MAVRLNSDASAFKRTANLPSSTSCTLACWHYVSTVPARSYGPIGLTAAVDGNNFMQISSLSSGSAQQQLWWVSGVVSTGVNLISLAAGFWYFFALTCSGTASGSVKGYARRYEQQSFSTAQSSSTRDALTPAALEFGRDSFTGDFMDGALGPTLIYDRALDARELLLVSYDLWRERIANRLNLNAYWRNRSSGDIYDLSGNGRNPTVTAGANFPDPRELQRRRVLMYLAGGGGDVSVALTGQALASAQGTLTPNSSVPMTGQAASSTAGTLTPALSLTLSGQLLASATGTTIPNLAKALTGQALAGAQGTLVPALSVPLTGLQITIAQGNVTAPGNVTVALTGQAFASAQGTLTPATSLALAGSQLASARGTLTPSLLIALSGQQLAAARGTMVPAMSVSLSGSLATFGQGNVSLGTGDPTPPGSRTVTVHFEGNVSVRAPDGVTVSAPRSVNVH